MGTRIGYSARFPSTSGEAYAAACGRYESIFEALLGERMTLEWARDQFKYAQGDLAVSLDRIARERDGDPTAMESHG